MGITIEEAISFAEKQAELLEESAAGCDMIDKVEKEIACRSGKCAAEHRQVAEWLKELREVYAMLEGCADTDELFVGYIRKRMKGEI